MVLYLYLVHLFTSIKATLLMVTAAEQWWWQQGGVMTLVPQPLFERTHHPPQASHTNRGPSIKRLSCEQCNLCVTSGALAMDRVNSILQGSPWEDVLKGGGEGWLSYTGLPLRGHSTPKINDYINSFVSFLSESNAGKVFLNAIFTTHSSCMERQMAPLSDIGHSIR